MSKCQRDVQRGGIEACALPALTNFVQKGREQRRYASADHNYVRFQEIDDVSEPVCQEVQRLSHYFFGDRIACCMSLSNHFAADHRKIATGHFHEERFGILLEFLTCTSGDRRTRRQRFDAAAFPTIAKRTAAVDSEMAAFPRGAGPSMINAAVKNDSCTDTGANACVKDVPIATPRAPLGFRQSRGIGVVIDPDMNVIKSPHLLGQRVVMPDREIWRIDDDPGMRIQWPWRANADCFNLILGSRVREKPADRH